MSSAWLLRNQIILIQGTHITAFISLDNVCWVFWIAFNMQKLILSTEMIILFYQIVNLDFWRVNGWQLAKMKKSIPDMSLPWNL